MSVVTISEVTGTGELEDRPERGAAVPLLPGIEVATEEGVTTVEVDVEAALASAELEIAAAVDIGCKMVETKVERIVEIVVVV